MILRVHHRTRFAYPYAAVDSHNEVRLAPRSDAHQSVRSFRLTTEPEARIFSYDTPGGQVHHFDVRPPHQNLAVVAEAIVETHLDNPFEGLNLLVDDWDYYASGAVHAEYAEYLAPSPYVPVHPHSTEIVQALSELRHAGQEPEDSLQGDRKSVATFLLDLSSHIHEMLAYDPDATHVHTQLGEVYDQRAGVCQDFAHVMIACGRAAGIPSRYVSGYLYVGPADTGMRGEQATHAWAEFLLPGGRWVGFDPTNRLLAGDHHIKAHTGRDYSEVTPTRGVYRGGPTVKLEVSVRVDCLEESIR